MSSTLTLSFPNSTSTLSLSITSAKITEGFDEIAQVECEAYYEGIQENLVNILDENKDFFYAKLYLSTPIASKRIGGDTQVFSLVGWQLRFLEKTSSHKSINQRFFFSFVLFSPLFLLKQNTSSRIFYQRSVVDVALSIFAVYAPKIQKEVDCSMLQGNYPLIEYITQYQESDFDFLRRICSNAGIFFLEQEDKIYLCDTPFITQGENTSASYETLTKKHSFPYKENPNNPLNEEFLHHLSFHNQLSCKNTLFSSFNPLSPNTTITTNSLALHSQETAFSSLTHSCAFASSLNTSEGVRSNLLALRAQMEGYILEAKSNILEFRVGDEVHIQSLSSSLLPTNLEDKENKYKIISITHYFKDKADLSSSLGGDGDSSYQNTIYLLSSSIPFFTRPIDKPRVYGGSIGLVVGESDENILENIAEQRNTIYTDTQGRIKVAFAYSLAQLSLDQKRFEGEDLGQSLNTCYLRVLNPVASENAGFFAIPRIGDEVFIQFLEGDCDKPIVAGSFYNTNSSIPHPQDHHFTSLSASTLGKENTGKRSEITLKTTPDREEVFIHAQKDRKAIIDHDDEELVKHNKKTTIKGMQSTHIALASVENVGGMKDVNVGAESMENVGFSKDTQVGGSYTINVGAEFKTRVAGEVQEYVGGSKEVQILENLNEEILGDVRSQISGSKRENIQGDYQLNTQNNAEIESQSQIHLKAKENIDLQSEHASILAKESTTIESKACSISTQEGASLEDKKEITLKVKEGIIDIKSDSIVLKAGGVEVTIGKDGLVVKGGEVKSE